MAMSEGNSVILRASGIHREFKTPERILSVLKGVNLEVNEGEFVAITGVSGVGKSTLLHILGGLDRPSRGEVILKNTNLGQQSEQTLARFRNAHVGFVFQFHYLLDDFDATENVMIPMLQAGIPRGEANERSRNLLGQVGLAERAGHRPRQLSGGEQQRVAVARALANRPDVILADEPSGNLDTDTGRSLHNLFLRLNAERGVTIVIATHNMELARQCRRHLRMTDGTIVDNGAGG
jgi:lipoprotein-releasing system ATP-binding protein